MKAGSVRYGRCDDDLAVPFQPFIEALRPAATAIGSDRLRAALGPIAAHLARLWPELEALGEPAPADPETDRYRLFEAVTALLEVVTRDRPALLVLDDLHWATQPTRLMLRHLIRSERTLRALIVAIYRETEFSADHPNRLLADLQRDTGATAVRLGAFGVLPSRSATRKWAVGSSAASSTARGIASSEYHRRAAQM
jgi:AAA ATPase domain